MILYSQQDSGNCYKVRHLLGHLGVPFEIRDIDANDGSTHSAHFLGLNPNGKVPLLQLEDGTRLAESNAILFYLGEGTAMMPQDRFARAKVMEWMFFEQYSHEPAIAVRRSLSIYRERASEAEPERMSNLLAAGRRALGVMEGRLDGFSWLACEGCSIADICLYAYTHLAPEGGFDLSPYPGIRRWLDRVEALPDYRPLNWRPHSPAPSST